jgi:RNA polymerase sigma-70 factor (ECF subfamily)
VPCRKPWPDEWAEAGAEAFDDPKALREAIAGLTPGEREAIERLKLREMLLQEASAASRKSIGKLKVSAHRAIASLRRALKRE